MQKVFLTTIIIILVSLTIFIGVKQPEMHKKLFVYNSDFEITEQEQNIQEENKNIPTQINTPINRNKVNQTEQTINVTKTIEQIKGTVDTITKKQPIIQTSQGKKTTQTQTQTKSTVINKVSAKAVEQKKVQPVEKKKVENTEQTKIKPIEQTQKIPPVKNETTVKQVQNPTPVKELTPEEEVILWNKWRSDLQNKIMNDVKLPIIQEGIIFKFSFDVDKYGKINNVKTWSTTPEYTPYAIQYIAPVIKSYQGKDILNFPEGSKRFTTTAQGAWKISKTVKYSTPSDYSDTEKLIK